MGSSPACKRSCRNIQPVANRLRRVTSSLGSHDGVSALSLGKVPMSSNPQPARGESWLKAWPDILGFAVGFLLIQLAPGPLSGNTVLSAYALFNGLSVAVSVGSIRILGPHLKRIRSLHQPPRSWASLLAPPIVLIVIGGCALYVTRLIALPRTDDLPLPMLNERIGLTYAFAISAVVAAATILRLTRFTMANVSHDLSDGPLAVELRSMLNRVRGVRQDLQRIFVVFGCLTVISTITLAAYNAVLKTTNPTAALSGEAMIAFGLLIGLVLVWVLAPVQMQFTRLGHQLIDHALPVPLDTADWQSWADSQASLKSSLGLTTSVINTWAIVFAVLSPLLAAGFASFLALQVY